MKVIADLYLSECPAVPTSHIKALEGREFDKSVTIYVTHGCNFRCKTCYLSAGEPLKNELSIENYEKIFREIRDLGFQIVYILGGEPLIRKDIFEIIKKAKENSLYVSMSSNGYFINMDNAERLKDSGLDQIQISLDSADERINDIIRGPGSYRGAIKAIENLKRTGIKTSLAFTITSLYSNVSEMMKFANSLGIKLLNISVVQPFGRALKNRVLPSIEQVTKAINDIKNSEYDIRLTFNGFRFYLDQEGYKDARVYARSDYVTCPAGVNRFVIDSNGDVYGCELLMFDEFKEGNIRERGISEIWRNGFLIFRERRLPKECQECPYRDLCQGGCPARAYLNGGLDRRDILCKQVIQ
jgi:radical SAM protein with 4Fe4S-binding SPASM domain